MESPKPQSNKVPSSLIKLKSTKSIDCTECLIIGCFSYPKLIPEVCRSTVFMIFNNYEQKSFQNLFIIAVVGYGVLYKHAVFENLTVNSLIGLSHLCDHSEPIFRILCEFPVSRQ